MRTSKKSMKSMKSIKSMKPKRKPCTRKAMIGGKKEVNDAITAAVNAMVQTGEFPELQKALNALVDVNAPSTVNAPSPTVNTVPPTVNATNESKTELPEKSVIQYGTDSKQSSTYLEIKKRLQKMIEKPNTMNPDNIPIETLKSRLEEITNAKTIPEVTAILQKYQFSDTHAQRQPAFLRFAMTGGGSRKHKMRKIKNHYTSK